MKRATVRPHVRARSDMRPISSGEKRTSFATVRSWYIGSEEEWRSARSLLPYLPSRPSVRAPPRGYLTVPQPPPLFRERVRRLRALAVDQGVDALTLGAWGCGAFRNEPQVVAPIFWEHLRPGGDFYGRFKKVQFSVLDTSKTQTIHNAFAYALAEGL